MRTVRVLIGSLSLVLLVLLLSRATTTPARAASPGPDRPPDFMAGIDCSQIQALGIDRQVNVRAALILQHCGLLPATATPAASAATRASALTPSAPMTVGGTDVQVNNAAADTYPHVTQNRGMIASDGRQVAVGFLSTTAAPTDYSGYSYSTDGGATFTEIRPSPFETDHGTNYGDPVMLYNSYYAEWITAWLTVGCGGQGLGTWRAFFPSAWSIGPCLHSDTSDDNPLGWVDNNPSSPYYARMYVTWNNYAVSLGALQVSTSSDGGSTWSAPVTIENSFIRNVFVTGDPDGTVYVVAENENGGSTNPRQNKIYRSTDGGTSWSPFSMGASFTAPGDTNCSGSYFRAVSPIWSEMGWGQAGVGPGGIIHYVYVAGGTGDSGNILYTRSADKGATWSTPIRLNTDTGTRAQWQPSLAVTANGKVVATWYDRRNTTDNSYQRFERISLNNGVSWQADGPLSDIIIPQPQQPDPDLLTCQAGRRTFSFAAGNTTFTDWTDGRITISVPQEDVYLDRIDTTTAAPYCTWSILLLHAEGTGLPTTLQEALLRQSGVGRVDLFNVNTGTPTLAQLKGYDAVYVYSALAFADPTALGNVLADYQDAGGVVIAGAGAFRNVGSYGIAGRWISGGYSPYNEANSWFGTSMDLGAYDSSSPLMAGITTLHIGTLENVTVASGATLVASWASSTYPLLAVKGRAVGINAGLTESGIGWKGQFAQLITNAIKTLHTGALVSCRLYLPLTLR